jgi:hypothetical protein
VGSATGAGVGGVVHPSRQRRLCAGSTCFFEMASLGAWFSIANSEYIHLSLLYSVSEVASPQDISCIHTAVPALPVVVQRARYAQFPAHVFGLPAAFNLLQRCDDLALGEFFLAHLGFLGPVCQETSSRARSGDKRQIMESAYSYDFVA